MDDFNLQDKDVDELMDVIQQVLPNFVDKIHNSFENWCRTVQHINVLQVEVPDIKTLCGIVKGLNELNQKRVKENKYKFILRVAAGCIDRDNQEHIGAFSNLPMDRQYQNSFSVSPCVEAHVILHLVGEEFYKIIINDVHVTVGPNVQIGPLEAQLYQSNTGLSLPVSPLIPWVTLIGLAANAGHGTGLNQPGITGLIESITMVNANGELKTISKGDVDFDIINGAHLGLFGLVTEITIKCIPACKLKATKYAWSLTEFFRQVEKEKLYEENEYVSVMYVPTYYSLEEEKNYTNVQVVVAKQVPIDTDDVNWSKDIQTVDDNHQLRELNIFNKLWVPRWLRLFPHLIPRLMHYIATKKVGIKDAAPFKAIGPFYQIAHYQRQFPRELDDIDFLFPVKDPKQMLPTLEKIITTLANYRDKGYYPVSDAIYIRMFKGTNGGLSTSSHQPDEYIAAIDIVTDPETAHYQLESGDRDRGLPNQFKEEIQKYFMDQDNKLNAKPHWGKTLPSGVDYEILYGNDFEQFMRVAENWYKDVGCTFATSPFMNPFFERIFKIRGSEPMPQPIIVSLVTNNIETLNAEEFKQLEEYANEVEEVLAQSRHIHSPEISLMAMPLAGDNSQVIEHDLPYIGLFNRAGDADGYRRQQQKIQSTGEEYLQEVRKTIEDARRKNAVSTTLT